jgi:exopolysaccharide production protein ExoZ
MTHPPESAAPQELRSIQYLRGVAAVGVLCFHAALRSGHQFGVGAAGVDIFFVISGFIMEVVTARRPVTPARFMVHRLERIVPLYWIATLAVVGAAVLVPSLFPALKPDLSRIVLSLVFAPHRDVAGLAAPIITAGWTLNYEMFFYVIFAGTLLAPPWARALLLSALLALLVIAGWLVHPSGVIAATYTNPLLLEFVAGVWIAKAWSRGWVVSSRWGALALAAGVAALTATAVAGTDIDTDRLLFWGAPAMLIVVGAIGVEAHGGLPRWPPVKSIGDASYSTYLVHGLAVSACARLLLAVGVSGGWPAAVVEVCGGLAAGLATFWLVERPLIAVFRHRQRRRATAAPQVVTASSV